MLFRSKLRLNAFEPGGESPPGSVVVMPVGLPCHPVHYVVSVESASNVGLGVVLALKADPDNPLSHGLSAPVPPGAAVCHVDVVDRDQASVRPGTPINTDGWKPYRKLPNYGYPHAWIDHETGEYLVEGVGTQQIENFWSNFKRGIYGVYRHCGPAYLQSYANEYVWRYSRRNSAEPMFKLLLDRATA